MEDREIVQQRHTLREFGAWALPSTWVRESNRASRPRTVRPPCPRGADFRTRLGWRAAKFSSKFPCRLVGNPGAGNCPILHTADFDPGGGVSGRHSVRPDHVEPG